MTTQRQLRPWVWNLLSFITGLIVTIGIIWGFCMTFEAMIGINPIDIVRGYF